MNLGGLERTVNVTRVLLAVALLALGIAVVAAWSSGDRRPRPADTDRAVALAAVLLVYVVVGVTALATVPTDALASTSAPLRLVAGSGGGSWAADLVRVGAGVAALGVLLNLIPGVSRTTLAMARNAELPRWLSAVDGRRALPVRAEASIAMVIVAVVAVTNLRSAIGISGVAVLTYYAITNLAALRLGRHERRWPRWTAVLGLVGCIVLIAALPPRAIATGTATIAIGVAVRAFRTRRIATGAGR